MTLQNPDDKKISSVLKKFICVRKEGISIKAKEEYIAPDVQIEYYQLDKNIASNCSIVVSNGPDMGTHHQCSDYKDPFSAAKPNMMRRAPRKYNVQFYEDTNCDCYDSSGEGYWTS